ncbi:MAG: hypothetical protein ACYTFW_01090 [Planctomycetota bacterium]|jgi:hypothetical protein
MKIYLGGRKIAFTRINGGGIRISRIIFMHDPEDPEQDEDIPTWSVKPTIDFDRELFNYIWSLGDEKVVNL